MKAKLRGTTGVPFEVREVSCHTYSELTGKEGIPFVQYYADGEGNIYKDEDLDFNLDPPQSEATISGWVCRERDGELLISSDKPIKRTVDDGTVAGSIEWTSRGFISTTIYSAFPFLTWQDDPIEVEITIKPKKQ